MSDNWTREGVADRGHRGCRARADAVDGKRERGRERVQECVCVRAKEKRNELLFSHSSPPLSFMRAEFQTLSLQQRKHCNENANYIRTRRVRHSLLGRNLGGQDE